MLFIMRPIREEIKCQQPIRLCEVGSIPALGAFLTFLLCWSEQTEILAEISARRKIGQHRAQYELITTEELT